MQLELIFLLDILSTIKPRISHQEVIFLSNFDLYLILRNDSLIF